MGYPMTYRRVVHRNGLHHTYGINDQGKPIREPGATHAWTPEETRQTWKACIAGDLRRLETDARDESHLALYAEMAGITPEQARKVLDAFFTR